MVCVYIVSLFALCLLSRRWFCFVCCLFMNSIVVVCLFVVRVFAVCVIVVCLCVACCLVCCFFAC